MTENSPEDIKRAVLSRYSKHAQRRLAALQEMAHIVLLRPGRRGSVELLLLRRSRPPGRRQRNTGPLL